MERWSNLLLHIAEVLDIRVFDLLYPGHRLPRRSLTELAEKREQLANDEKPIEDIVDTSDTPKATISETTG